MKRIPIYLIASLFLLASCNGKLTPDTTGSKGTQICFNIPQDLSVKAPVFTDAELIATEGKVFVRGTQGGVEMTNYGGVELSYIAETGIWTPPTYDASSLWQFDDANNRGYSYQFWAYGYNDANATGATATPSTTGENFGKSLTLVQPETYVHSDTGFGYDYLLSQVFNAVSYKVKDAAGTETIHGPVVNLHMEHALALIEVRVKIQKDIYQVKLQGVAVSDFASGGSLNCTDQAEYGNSTGATNQWSSTSLINYGTVYSRGGFDPENPAIYTFEHGRTGDNANEQSVMLFTAIPQQMKNTTITVAMLIQESATSPEHQFVQTWELNNYYDWESGFKNVYTISIDTSNKLDATISEWPTVNNVSGTILPKI